jgi:hypothetical protein
MGIDSRLRELEKIAHQHRAALLFKELLGSACIVLELAGEPVQYRTKNGKIYSREELTEVIRKLRQAGSIDSPVITLSEPKKREDALPMACENE